MTGPSPDQPIGGADHTRSGDDVAEAIEVAERGSSVQDVHDAPQRSTSGEAPVEQAAGDPEMSEGQVVYGDDADGGTPPGAAEPASSGAAQSQRGARASDLRAAGDDDTA
jgi:hypothetical protein